MNNKMTQGFDDAFKKISKVNLKTHTELWGEPKTEKLYFESGAASRQAEIDELQKRLAMYEREGYKLVSKSFIADIHDMALDGKYLRETDQSQEKFTEMHELCKEVMIGAVE